MKFIMNVVKNGQHVKWTYDAQDNSIYDENDKCLNPKALIEPQPVEQFTYDNNPNVKTNNTIEELEIVLGFNCNFSCSYCGQSKYKDVMHSGTPDDVDEFIKKLARLNCKKLKNILIWGGEPLVYWKTLKLLLPKLRELYPSVGMCMHTNGSLLDIEKVEFLNKYNLRTIVSYDCAPAADKNERHIDVFSDPKVKEAVLHFYKLNPALINLWVTILSGNTDFNSIHQRIVDILGIDDIKTEYVPVKCSDINELFTQEEYDQLVDQYYKIMNKDHCESGWLNYHYNMFMRRLLSKSDVKYAYSHCGLGFTRTLCVSLDGTVYNCHMRPKAIGDVKNVKQLNITGLIHWTEHEYCHKCPWIQICGGLCYTLEGDSHRYGCIAWRTFAEALFKVAIGRSFGVYVKNVEYEESDIIDKLNKEKGKVIPIKPNA